MQPVKARRVISANRMLFIIKQQVTDVAIAWRSKSLAYKITFKYSYAEPMRTTSAWQILEGTCPPQIMYLKKLT